MKYLFINTAGTFSQDYKTHGFINQGKLWEEYAVTAKTVLLAEAPFSRKCIQSCLDLGSRVRSSCLWITKDKASRKLLCVSSLKGIASGSRRDFTGRVIFDSVMLVSSCLIGSPEEFEMLLEHESIARGFAGATLDRSFVLDNPANMEDFSKDLFPFSDVNMFFESLPSDISDPGAISSAQDGLGLTNSIMHLIRELGISFSVRHQDSPSQGSGQSPEGSFGASTNPPPSDRQCLLDEAFKAVDAVEEKVEELASELVGEQRAGSLLRPLKKIRGLFPGNLRNVSRPVERRSSNAQSPASPDLRKPGQEDCAISTITISSAPSREHLSRLIHELFVVAAKSESFSVGILNGGGDQQEMIYGTGRDPAELVLVVIRQ
jgi:hypothetical protein